MSNFTGKGKIQKIQRSKSNIKHWLGVGRERLLLMHQDDINQQGKGMQIKLDQSSRLQAR